MATFTTVEEYKTAILAELPSVESAGTRRLIQDFLAYAEKTEKEAENRELRPRPDGSESAAYYREAIDFGSLPTQSLRELLEGLLQLVEGLEA